MWGEVRSLADRQHGVVARRQLLALGASGKWTDYRVSTGELRVVYRGVYVLGHLTREGRWMAAVLAAGDDAVLSHRSAGALWGILAYDGPPEVTLPRASKFRWTHRSSVAKAEQTTRNRIPVTTPTRTIEDLARVLPAKQLERVHREAQILGLPLRLTGTRRPAIRALTETPTRSELEAEFQRFLKRHRIPRPETNVRLPFGECDCVWRRERLIVELDGHAVHATRSAFERDRVRDREAALAGWRVVRITWRQLRDDPERVARDLRKLLGVPTA